MAKKSKQKINDFDVDTNKKAKKHMKKINAKGSQLASDPKQADKKYKTKQNEKFNFDNEIIIGVNVIPSKKKDKPSKKSKNKNINKKNKQKSDNVVNAKHIDVNINSNIKNKKINENVVPLEKKKTKGRKIKTILKIILIILLFIGTIIFIMTTSLFNVTQIEVIGNYRVTKQRIESLSQINLNVNTYRYSKKDIIQNIKEEPYIESLQVKRKLPNTIKIQIKERTPNYMFMYSNNYVYINNYGYILEISNEPLNLPLIQGYTTSENKIVPGNRLDVEDLTKLNTVLKITESMANNEIADKITTIDISNKNNYIIKMESEGKIVYLGDASNINDRILMLKEILIKEANFKGEIFMQDLKKIYFRQES